MSSLNPVFRLSLIQKTLITSFTIGFLASFVYLIWLNSQLSQLIRDKSNLIQTTVFEPISPPVGIHSAVSTTPKVVQSASKSQEVVAVSAPAKPAVKTVQKTVTPSNTHSVKKNQTPKNYFSKTESTLSAHEQANQVQAQAVQWIQNGRALDAEKLLLDYLHQNSESESVRECLVKLYLKQERFLESEHLLLTGIQKQPNVSKHFLLLSRLYHQQERYDDAVNVLQKLPESVQNEPECVTLLASCYYESELYKEAIEQYSKLVNLSTEQPRGWLGLALSQEALGKKSAALDYYRKTISLGHLEPSVIRFVRNKIAGLSRTDQNQG